MTQTEVSCRSLWNGGNGESKKIWPPLDVTLHCIKAVAVTKDSFSLQALQWCHCHILFDWCIYFLFANVHIFRSGQKSCIAKCVCTHNTFFLVMYIQYTRITSTTRIVVKEWKNKNIKSMKTRIEIFKNIFQDYVLVHSVKDDMNK